MYLEFVSQLSDKELLFLLENALRIKLGYFVDINIINIHIYMGDIYDIFVIKTNMGDILINDFLSQSQSTNFIVSHKQHGIVGA